MDTDTIKRATQLWGYMSSFQRREATDAIVVCCSYDLRVYDHACDLIKMGLSDTVLLSRNTGNWTNHIWNSPEALITKRLWQLRLINPVSVVIGC